MLKTDDGDGDGEKVTGEVERLTMKSISHDTVTCKV